MALVLFKSCLSRGIISIRKNILHIAPKIWRVFSWKPRHPNEMSKRFERQKIQIIILSVAGSGVIEKITLKSVIIYESRLFCLTWICLDWISAKSAILKILEAKWCVIFWKKSHNFKTILAGSKPMVLHCRLVVLWKQYTWMKLQLRFNVGSPIWLGGGSIVSLTWICWGVTFPHLPSTLPSGRRD